MSLFTRMSDIVQSNVHAMLDKAEDPHKVVRLIIQEMEETLVELRTVTARHLAEQKTLARRADALSSEAEIWLQKAEIALAKEKEALARAALTEKQACLDALDVVHQQQATIADALEKLAADAQRLHAKLAEVKHTEKQLQVRQHTATVQLQTRAQAAQHNFAETLARFERYEQKLDALDAQVDAYAWTSPAASTTQVFADLNRNAQVDAALAELKAKRSSAA